MRYLAFLLLAISGGALAGCASDPTIGPGSTAVSVASSLPPPDESGTSVDFGRYQIGPLDVIRVEVFGAPELTREAEVDAAGNFSLPLAGAVRASGRTPAEFGEAIASALRERYLRNPQVSVNVIKAQPKTFSIDGAVRQPGNYPIIGKMTLQQAIASARGTDQAANLNNVVIFRTIQNRKAAALFSLKEIRAGRLEDPSIYGNDVIVVGESGVRRFLRDFGSLVPVLGQFVWAL